MLSTNEGMPLLGAGGGDPETLRRCVAEARELADPEERAVRLYFLGRGLLDCDDPNTGGEAVAVLHEAMKLGSPHAAFDLGCLLLKEAESLGELQAAKALLERAAAAGLAEATEVINRLA